MATVAVASAPSQPSAAAASRTSEAQPLLQVLTSRAPPPTSPATCAVASAPSQLSAAAASHPSSTLNVDEPWYLRPALPPREAHPVVQAVLQPQVVLPPTETYAVTSEQPSVALLQVLPSRALPPTSEAVLPPPSQSSPPTTEVVLPPTATYAVAYSESQPVLPQVLPTVATPAVASGPPNWSQPSGQPEVQPVLPTSLVASGTLPPPSGQPMVAMQALAPDTCLLVQTLPAESAAQQILQYVSTPPPTTSPPQSSHAAMPRSRLSWEEQTGSDGNDTDPSGTEITSGGEEDEERLRHAVVSEAAELRVLQRVRAVMRSTPRQERVSRGVHTDRWRRVPRQRHAHVVGGDLHIDACSVGQVVGVDDYVKTYANDRDFIAHFSFTAITARHSLFANMTSRWRLLEALPDTDGTGAPITEQQFTERWANDAQALLKHLFKKHEGEVAELQGEWVQLAGLSRAPHVQEKLSHVQFSHSRSQWIGTNQVAAKGKLGKGTKEQSKPAVGGKGVVAHDNRVLWVDTNGEAWTRDATVSSLPSLFLELGKIWSAVELYGYWTRCQLL